MNAAVIGAGIGGLAAALRLRAAGHEVTLFEQSERAGGKIGSLRTDGFRFDTGPSLLTLPALADELYALFGERMEDEVPCRRLESNCRYFFPDGSRFTFYDDPLRLEAELRAQRIARPEELFARLRRAREMYELGAPVFLFNDFHRLANFRTPPFRHVAARLGRLDFVRTMHGANRRDFTDERLIRIFDRYATYNGSDPYRAPATLNMIAHLENNLGAYLPERGMRSLADGLYALACRHGVRFRLGECVERILLADGRTRGIRTRAGDLPFDAVISDADANEGALRLIDGHPLARRLANAEPSLSALVFFWAVEGTTPDLDVHNILFSSDYRSEFRSLFGGRTLPDDPTVYLFIGSKISAGDAPAGCENWFVMVNAPADCGQDWPALTARIRRTITRKIDRTLRTDIRARILSERTATPRTIGRDTLCRGGALYGASSNSVWSAFLRHPNTLRNIRNLYFVGGSVHPGGGIPLCLAGAEIVARRIAEDHE